MNVTLRYHISGRRAADIAASVERGIRDGAIVPGCRLPPVRTLSHRLGVSVATVASAYRELRQRGLVTASGRQGTTVAPRGPLAPRGKPMLPPGVRDLGSGNPDPRLLPDIRPLLATLDVGPVLYGQQPSDPELVALAAERFRRDGVPSDHITVVGGAMDGLELVLSSHLRPGDRIVVEDPCYTGFGDLIALLGLVPRPVPVDDSGPDPDALRAALQAGAAACMVTPRAQNPYGSALDPGRTAELRSVIRRHPGVLVIEDDHAADITEPPGATLCDADRQRWAQVRSVSKSLGPDLRLALVAGDATTVARVEGRRLLGAGWVSHLLQRLIVALWNDPGVPPLLQRAVQTYTQRRRALCDALAARGIEVHARSGLNAWIPVAHEDATVASLLQQGWGVLAGERFRIATGRGIRVTTATLEPSEVEEFVTALTTALTPPASRLA